MLYSFVPSLSTILTLLCISEWLTRTCTNIHIGDTRIRVTEHRRSACGDVSVILPHRTVSPSWCLARLPPDVSGHWDTASQSAITLHCRPGGCILSCLCFMWRCGVKKHFHPSENEQQNKQNIVRYGKTEEQKTYSHQLIFPWCDW